MQRFELERITLAISSNALCEDALEKTLHYMNEREAFGRKINSFQELRHRIAQLTAELEMSRAFSYQSARMFNDGIYAVKQAAMAKLLATELADKFTYQCLQFFGGYGFMEEYPLARMWRDARLGTIGGGSSEIMREIISKLVIDQMHYKV
jgi:alkylation response protein AidB-like acyl-CoA dehydrogenase